MTVSQMKSDTRIGPDDARYLAILNRRFNKRFCARPDYIMAVSSTDQIVSAVQQAVTEGRRLVVTSGGHCLEGFVSDPEVRVIIDVSPMKGVYFYPQMRAVAVEAGPQWARRSGHCSRCGELSYHSVNILELVSAGTWSVAPLVSSAASSG